MAATVEKVSTGIPGLDNMLYGGVPATNEVLVAGGPGAGKTLMCFQIVYSNAKAGKQTLFVTLEEKVDDVLKNARNAFTEFTDIDDLIAKKTLNIIGDEIPVPVIGSGEKEELFSSFSKVVTDIENAIKETNAKVVVIDSLSLLSLASGDKDVLTYRRALLGLMTVLRRLEVTAFLTVELETSERANIMFSQEFFIFDGIFVMYQSENNERRTLNLEIVKMRRTNHSLSFAPYEITEKGFRVFAVDTAERF
jgi:KaiC/GvpD/RAD55 family RecA-like ATPase